MPPWDAHHGHLAAPHPYGSSATYRAAERLLADCATVEDWGCGGGGFTLYRTEGVVGVDSSASPYASITADLTRYTSQVEGILLRHVIEHSYDWPLILINACRSVTKRLVVILFTPLADGPTTVLFTEPDYDDVPVISFRLDDVLDVIHRAVPDAWINVEGIDSPESYYNHETVITVDV